MRHPVKVVCGGTRDFGRNDEVDGRRRTERYLLWTVSAGRFLGEAQDCDSDGRDYDRMRKGRRR